MRSVDYLVVAAVFVLSGTVATIANKWQDIIQARDIQGNLVSFEHPVFQTWVMFAGMFACLIPFLLAMRRKQRLAGDSKGLVPGEDYGLPCSRWVYVTPALCDFTASTLSFTGLAFTHASVFQMLSGSVVVFTALFSRVFLHRSFDQHQVFGLVLVTIGLVLVGFAGSGDNHVEGDGSSLVPHRGAKNPLLGNALVIIAQIVAAAQFTYEEHVVGKYKIPPLQLVGTEGLFGIVFTGTILFLLELSPWRRFDSIREMTVQLHNLPVASVAIISHLIAAAFYNGAAVTITKEASATTRMVLDTLRNVGVWIISLAFSGFFGESFRFLQLIGFITTVTGTAVYQKVFFRPPSSISVKSNSGLPV
jgi:drug/metabolite transporter (DMT)-like permease